MAVLLWFKMKSSMYRWLQKIFGQLDPAPASPPDAVVHSLTSTSDVVTSYVEVSEFEAERWWADQQRHFWWADQQHLVESTDEALRVIQPGWNCSPGDLRAIGCCLKEWRDRFPGAKHIWGLEDLLEGKWPRTPPDYLYVPFDLSRPESAEPVAVVLVAKGTDHKVAVTSLSSALEALGIELAWFTDVMAYSQFHR